MTRIQKRIARLNRRVILIRDAHKRAESREDWRTVGKLEDQFFCIQEEMKKLMRLSYELQSNPMG